MIVLGLISGVLLFLRHSALPRTLSPVCSKTISVIIPARNEQHNLPKLLEDLRQQEPAPLEIIVVDDQSEDNTAAIAQNYRVKLISITDKPADWLGKNWACHQGSQTAQGDILLFLDADVRLAPGALQKLRLLQESQNQVISVQPYQQVRRFYEYFSFFFALLQIAGNGLSFISSRFQVSLFGPVICLSRSCYEKLGGHESVRNELVEDLALGKRLKQLGMPFSLYSGGKDVQYRMYGDGLRSLIQGWTKNFSTGTGQASKLLLLLSILWLGGCTTAVVAFGRSLFSGSRTFIIIFGLLYLLWQIHLLYAAKITGNFKKGWLLLFPLYNVVFYLLFIRSLYTSLFRRNVLWKNRIIKKKR